MHNDSLGGYEEMDKSRYSFDEYCREQKGRVGKVSGVSERNEEYKLSSQEVISEHEFWVRCPQARHGSTSTPSSAVVEGFIAQFCASSLGGSLKSNRT